MKKNLFCNVAMVLAVAFSAQVAAAGGFGFNKASTVSVGAEAGAASNCSGYCESQAVAMENTTAEVEPGRAEYSFNAAAGTYVGGLDFGFLAMESGILVAGGGVASASKRPAKSGAIGQGQINSIGLGDIVIGEQSLSGEVHGYGYDSAGCEKSGSGGYLAADQSMVAISGGGQSAGAYVGSATDLSLEVERN